MTTVERDMMRAQIALLRSRVPDTKGTARYGDDDWRRALAKVSERLTQAPYRRQAR